MKQYKRVTTIGIADDHPIFRKGLREIIEQEENQIILFEVGNGKDALEDHKLYQPDIMILDISLGDISGLEVAEKILKNNNSAICIIMTMYNEQSFCEKAISIGAKGYLVKDDGKEVINECIKRVLNGNIYISECLAMQNIDNFTCKKTPEEVLSGKELTILNEIALLKTSKEISISNNVSLRTVQNHRQNISKKLQLSGRQALLHYAVVWKKKNLHQC